jgi:hypothetical protein
MTPKEAIEVMAILTAAYPNFTINAETIEIYSRFLMDMPFGLGEAIALKLISENKWFPSISEIREAVIKIMPNEIPSTEEAWLEVMDNIRSVGSYGSPTFSNPLIGKAVNAIGWRELCLSDNPIADRAHFFKIYESYRNREVEDNLMLPEIKRLKEKIRLQIESKEVKQLSEILKDYMEVGKCYQK